MQRRSVEDVALLFSAMAGPDARSPIALETPGEREDNRLLKADGFAYEYTSREAVQKLVEG